MSSHKEIGGYFELESYGAPTYHGGAILLSSGRNALKYIIRTFGIERMYVPFYTCPVVWEAIREEGCEALFYEIKPDFTPKEDLPEDAFILVNDYFGVCGSNIEKLATKHRNLVVDNAQSFYAKPNGVASFYSPRKFFGLPDGGLLICSKKLDQPIDKDVSHGRMSHLLKRHEYCASEGYDDFVNNDKELSRQPLLEMSSLTAALMGNINYESVRKTRCGNFKQLHESLANKNELKLPEKHVCPQVYPFLLGKPGIRKRFIDNNIYVAEYWSGVATVTAEGSYSNYLREYLLPLPIDQRYGVEDMSKILDILYGSI